MIADQGVLTELGLAVIGRFDGGEHGALAVEDGNGTRQVLKLFTTGELDRLTVAIDVATQSRERGVPVPDPYVVGRTTSHAYTLQRHCPGAVPEWFADAHARQLLQYWEAHVGGARGRSDWPERMVNALVHTDHGVFVAHEPIRGAGGGAAALLDEIEAVGRTADPSIVRRDDLMHADWHHRNHLAEGDTVTAVIDWENARPGDARADLVLLNYWCDVYEGIGVDPTAAERVRSFTIEDVDPDARRLLAAYVALVQLWFVTSSRPERLEETVDHVTRHLAPSWR
jgi:Phosphotransferase enzyme family